MAPSVVVVRPPGTPFSVLVVRKPYTGSCHCGFIKYIAHITLPVDKNILDHLLDQCSFSSIFKCNCAVCTKSGFFHCHIKNPSEDFVFLSPIPDQDANLEGLGNYKAASKPSSLVFCQNCDVTPFTIIGKGETVELDIGEWTGKEPDGKKTTAWQLQKDARVVFTVNLVTIDQDQGLDLREIVDNEWVAYVDMKEPQAPPPPKVTLHRPYEGGMY